ncbi:MULTISPECIES: neuraminidase-like domain-containing protein [unclassified Okeania]|uniref:Tc toxin subunit A-related protein n=1 Tax=unclassified Okeania TaxID=2634635 RepID=UPI0013B7270B|nr:MULTISPECIES: neuraminidase-like domain-containing protein [unclassified Okeania]NES76316.1 LamG domain-containing protein [Okeania sp. SIO1H4]NET19761.1 LamG domain-containing protein [Okeania sp. SIO1H5]NET97160.1 LamG domain-containing protein [Okeania sp. SIO1H2]
MKIYVNGTLWHSEGDKNQPINLANKVVLGNFISNNGTLSNNWYEGLVAHLQIYSKELSPTEINKKYLFLSQVERFREATKLSIEEFNQFYPNYRVKDDADNSYETNKVYGTYISNGHNLTLKTVDAKLVMGHDDGTYLNHDFFYRFNRIIRLQKRTNIPYYQLDWLLNTIEDQDGLIDDDRLNVIAHYLDWNHKYQFSVDEFVGILTEINSYRRMGEQETSLLRQIFGNAAPKLVKVLKDGSTKFADLESSLKEYLIIGLRITFAEYNAIVKVITNNDENAKFDKAALARMYRLVKVFTLFGWGIAKGIELVEKLGLIEVFAHPGQKVSDVLSALDKLVWLSEWINAEDNNLTIDNILTILTPPDDAGTLQATVEVEEFLDLLEQDIEEHRVVEQSFTNYESWQIIVEKAPEEDHEGIGIMGIPADIWYQLLQENEPKIIDKYGLVLNVEKANIAEGVTKIIKDKIEAAAEKGYQLTLTESAEGQKQELIVEIANFQRRQQESLAKIITEKLSGLSSEIIPDLLRWMGIDYYETLKQLLGLQDKEVPEKLSQDTLKLLYNINRHGIVISQLELDTYTVSIAAEKPEWLVEWLVEEMSHKLSLEQVYYLYKFKTLLNAKVSSQHWFVYLAAVNEGELEEEEQNKLLAAFLDWSVEDIPNLTNKITYSLVKTVQQIEYLRRQIELCQDLHIQGEQLQWFHHYDIIPDFWQQVVPVVKLGLNRQNDEVRKKTAKDAINLELRDALVANFMNEVVGESESPALKEKIKSWEDIYQYLLLDVNVSYEVPTTRLLECTGAVQLYINRMIQGVEDANWEKGQLENLKKDWDISQQYRLWEANKKLGLYPSNYIEPTLRLHKTEIFKTFEDSLGQGSLNEEMVQQAIMQYLQQLQQLSELRVEGFTYEDLRDSIEFCFTAKATWETNSYYYRLLRVDKAKLEAGSKYAFEWGDWIKAELVFSQQHIYGVAPCYGWNRLYMYWFELFETRSEDGETTEYYLQPKYCRQNTDGSFGQPRNSVCFQQNIADNSSLQLYLPLDKIVDGKVIDLSKNNRNCKVHGGVNVVTDTMFGSCIRFNGEEDQYIEIPKEAIPDTNEITVSFWAYGDSSAYQTSILYAVNDQKKRILNIHLPYHTQSNNKKYIFFDCGYPDNLDRINKVDSSDHYHNKWTYWAFTKNVATGSMKIYVNGTLWHSGVNNNKPINSVERVVLGRSPYEDYLYKGKVANLQIYNRELSPSEISKIASQGIKINYLGENIVENLQVKIYQPYFDQSKQQILMYFSTGGVDKNLSFSSVTSKEETVVNIISKVPSKDNEIPEGYYEIDRSHPPQVRIQPESATNSIIDMKLAPQVLSEGGIQLNWELDCRESDYNLIRNRYGKGRKSVDRDDNSNNSQESIWVELAASGNEFEQKNIELTGQENSEGNNLLGIGNKKDFVRFNPPNENQTEFDITFKLCTDWKDRSAPDQNRDSNQGRKDTLFTFRVHYDDGTSQQSVFVRQHTQDKPHLADQRFLLFSYNGSFYTTNLYSTIIQKIVELANPYYDIHQLFSLDNQTGNESGVPPYLQKLDKTETYHNVTEPKPDIYVNFWGPYGIYAWEIFHYIPLMVAYKYTQSQNFDLAKKWLKHVYDPTLKDNPWRNKPLKTLPDANSQSALGINDPDAIARENPLYYRLSTIRQYIQNLIEQGDYYYRQITTETLRQAKMYYVEAKNIFIEGEQSLANVQLGEDWNDPTLGDVADVELGGDFIEPYDEEIMKVYQTIEQRLYNLRHWLAIDGTPLNIPLIAPPIDPRVLQQAALAGVSLTQPQQQATRTLNYDFDDILGRARGYVQDLISWSTNLLQYWENYENIQYQNLESSLISFDSAIFMQEKTIEALEKNIEIQRKTKKQTEHERNFYEVEKIWTTTVDGALQVAYGLLMAEKYFSIPTKVLKGALKLVPRIFGFSMGGYDVSGPAEAVDDTLETNIEIAEVMIEWLQGTAEIGKNFRELEFNEHQTTMAIEIIDQEIEVSNIELEIERQVLEDIKGDKKDSETLAAFNQKRFTNEMFFKWYVDNLKQLYRTLFDQTVSFCLLAERVYQEETGEKTIFIRPQWDDVYHGLLSGQKLLLNLQQMEYSYLQKTLHTDQENIGRTFSLEEKDDNILASLKTHGKAVIHIQESWFDEDFPEEFGRRIQSVKVKLLGLGDGDPIAAELTQISNRYSAKERTLQRVCAYGKIKLLGVETDTATMKPKQKGRLLPFEGSGVESTWLLSVPAAVKAIQEKQITYKHKSTLENIKDIEITIRYTAKY